MRLYEIREKLLPLFVIFISVMANLAHAEAERVSNEISLPGKDIRLTTELAEGTPQEISKLSKANPGSIVMVDAEVYNSIKDKLPDQKWIHVDIPTENGTAVAAYATQPNDEGAKKIQSALNESKLTRILNAIVGASFSAGGIVIGKVFANVPLTHETLTKVAIGWGISFMLWYGREIYSTLMNYKSRTWEEYLESKKLKEEFLTTKVRPENLKDASKVEQLSKLYALEVVYMSIVYGIPTSLDSLWQFVKTSIVYTATTTYDFIILRERDRQLTIKPETHARLVVLSANLVSMALTGLVNGLMINSAAGSDWAFVTITAGAVAFNTYYFWGALKSALAKFRDRFLKNVSRNELACASLF